MKLVAESFAWPFRGSWLARWLIGVALVLFLPVTFIVVLGYAIAATRSAETDPSSGPPAWRPSRRLLTDGFWTSLAVAVTVVPFALLLNPLSDALANSMAALQARVIALLILALPWGLLVLLVMPHATARFAATHRAADLFNYPAVLRDVAADFATWNIVAAAMVTAWAVGVACVGLLCIGVVPGIFYAILVSAHAAAALRRQGSPAPAR